MVCLPKCTIMGAATLYVDNKKLPQLFRLVLDSNAHAILGYIFRGQMCASELSKYGSQEQQCS